MDNPYGTTPTTAKDPNPNAASPPSPDIVPINFTPEQGREMHEECLGITGPYGY